MRAITLIIAALCLTATVLAAEPVRLVIGQMHTVTLKSKALKVSIGDPEIADVAAIEDKDIQLIAKGPGTTTLSVKTEDGEAYELEIIVTEESVEEVAKELRDVFVDIRGVEVKAIGRRVYVLGYVLSRTQMEFVNKAIGKERASVVNLVRLSDKVNDVIAEQMRTVLADVLGKRAEGIRTRVVNQRIVLEGYVDDEKTYNRATKLANLIFPDVLVMLTERDEGPTIQVDAYIMMVNRSRARRFGIKLLQRQLVVRQRGGIGGTYGRSRDKQTDIIRNRSYGGAVQEVEAPQNDDNQSVPAMYNLPSDSRSYGRNVLESIARNASFNMFFSATVDNNSTIDLMETYGLGRVLASPKLICKNGKRAAFLHGQEYPVQTIEEDGKYYVKYKPVGIRLVVAPRVMGEFIDMEIEVELSELGSYAPLGNPVIETDSIKNHVVVRPDETIALSGLSERAKVKAIDKTPFFGDVPLVGYFFRTTETQIKDMDLVFFITPHIVTADSEANRTMMTRVERGYERPAESRSALFYGMDRDLDSDYDRVTPEKKDFQRMNPYRDFESESEPIEYPGKEEAEKPLEKK